MKSRIIGALAALVLAVVGTVLLVSYVSAADARALAGTETVNVLVVTTAITEGTPAEQLAGSVSVEAVPAKVVPPGSVQNLEEIAGEVSTVDLLPGEQLVTGRFADPASLETDTSVKVPEGMQEVTVQLEPQRVVGGQLEAGDTVGVFISMDGGSEGSAGGVTHLTLHKVLVTSIQGLGAAPAEAETTAAPGEAPVPPGSVLVTLARTGADAEKIVFAQEFGRIWLSKEPESASETGTRELTREGIYK